jgi:preprotein translocase subunit SecA
LELKKEEFNTSTNEDSNIREVSEVQSVKREEPKVGRNELVKITNGQEMKEVKYKKAASLIETGEWRMI